MGPWDVLDAVDYARKELRAMPLSPIATFVPFWLATLESLSRLGEALVDGRDATAVASAKRDLSAKLAMFYVAGDAVERLYYERVLGGFSDAGEKISEW